MSALVDWIEKPGFYPGMSADRYFADPCPTPSLRQSAIPELAGINARSPLHFALKHPRLNPYGREGTSSRAQFLGSAVHRLALGAGRDVSVIRYPDYKSPTARAARDLAIANGRIPVLEREHVRALDMAAILRDAIEDELGGAPYQTEVPFFWIEQTAAGPVWCAGMLDVWCESLGIALDPKTTSGAATREAFGKDAAANGYDLQGEWYPRGIGKLRPELQGHVRFRNLVVETAEPFGFRSMQPSESTRYIASRQCDQALELFGQCLHGRSWPSYPREVEVYSTPSYYQNAIMARESGEELP